MMTGTPIERLSPGMVEITVEDFTQIDRALDNAVSDIKDVAAYYGTGIMITRIALGHYIVRAHPAVPCGLIRQSHK